MSIKAILFDVIGTTVIEKEPSVVSACFREAFRDASLDVSANEIQTIRGRDKRDAISNILSQHHASLKLTESILQSFNQKFLGSLDKFAQDADFVDLVAFLKSRGVKVGIGSGLSADVFELLYKHLGWDDLEFDYLNCSELLGYSRPNPAMILDMLVKLNLKASEVMKVGDTPADIHEGRNAGVTTVAILSGTCSYEEIRRAMPDHIIERLDEIRTLV